MAATDKQRTVFLKLKNNINDNACWEEFSREWDGFFMAIIRKKLYFDASIHEDAKMLALVKVFKYIQKFDVSKEPSPWLSRVIVSACEDTKREYGHIINTPEIESLSDKYNDIPEDMDSDLLLNDDVWCCVEQALESLRLKDERMKTAFVMFYRNSYKLKEIAGIFGVEQSTVNNWPGTVLKKILPSVKASLEELGYGRFKK